MLQTIKEYWNYLTSLLPKPLKNFFVVSGIVFVLWMIFIDIDRLPRQWHKHEQNAELEREINYYQEKINKGNEDLIGIKTDPEKLEKLAREKYYMHKKTEDVYVIEKKD